MSFYFVALFSFVRFTRFLFVDIVILRLRSLAYVAVKSKTILPESFGHSAAR